MKAIKLLFAGILACTSVISVQAQTEKDKTVTFKVYGECGMCKKRIEKAASAVDGVKTASWNEKTKVFTLKYDEAKKDAVDNVEKKIILAGYDTEHYKATAEAYKSLPECCQYERKP